MITRLFAIEMLSRFEIDTIENLKTWSSDRLIAACAFIRKEVEAEPDTNEDFPAVLEAARLGVCNPEIQEDVDIG